MRRALHLLEREFKSVEKDPKKEKYPRVHALVDVVVSQGDLTKELEAYAGFKWLDKELHRLDKFANGVGHNGEATAGTIMRSRLMRIHNMARSPFDLTLVADDDTIWRGGRAVFATRRFRRRGRGAAVAPM